jgi:tol-pal system protein YbgF
MAVILAASAGAAQAAPSGPWSPSWWQKGAQAQQAQAGDAAIRVNQLEEAVRALNGKIEDLNFTILQLQEQLRKLQEDNEFRFQELEQQRGSVARRDDSVASVRRNQDAAVSVEQGAQQENSSQEAPEGNGAPIVEQQASGEVRTIDGVEIFEGKQGQPEPGGQTLGRLVFDANGNLVDTQIEKPVELSPPQQQAVQQDEQAAQNQQTASLADPAKAADQAYDLGYTYVQAGDYRHAANSFREFVNNYPKHAKIAEANFWLGESLLAMRDYEGAAKVFLAAHKKYPGARLAPQTLMKLGVSLMGLNQRELACATFAEVAKKYPKASESVRTKVTAEQKAANCTAG